LLLYPTFGFVLWLKGMCSVMTVVIISLWSKELMTWIEVVLYR
jgi:hypothetical protein